MAGSVEGNSPAGPDAAEAAFLSPGVVVRAEDGGWTLLGGACADCGTHMFPRAPVCPSCMSEAVLEEAMPRHGTLYSFTVLHVGAAKWRKPLTLGYVDLPNTVRVFTHLVGDVAIGDPVRLDRAAVGQTSDGAVLENFVFRKGTAS